MKKSIFFFCFLLIGAAGYSQSDQTDKMEKTEKTKVKFPEYVEKGTIPAFSIIESPDSTAFTDKDLKKNTPLLVMIFSPECGHCQHEAQMIEQNMEHFKDAQILMVTWLEYSSLAKFASKYGTSKYSNITLAQDPNDFFYDFYEVHRYPKLVVYNKNGNYVSDYDGDIKLEDVWKDLGAE